jgi:hypothetical protein
VIGRYELVGLLVNPGGTVERELYTEPDEDVEKIEPVIVCAAAAGVRTTMNASTNTMATTTRVTVRSLSIFWDGLILSPG